MSWSIELRNGDLALRGASLGQVTGAQKLVQDLRCALLEQRGNDNAQPNFGSLLDGGRDASGNEIPSMIGGSDLEYTALRIEAEVRRVAAEHQRRQLDRAQNDRFTYGESKLGNGELLVEVSGISMVQVQDTLMVNVHLTTGDGQTIPINVPVSD